MDKFPEKKGHGERREIPNYVEMSMNSFSKETPYSGDLRTLFWNLLDVFVKHPGTQDILEDP